MVGDYSKTALDIALGRAEKGKRSWKRITEKQPLNADICYILMPTTVEALNKACIHQIKEYVEMKYYSDFVLVSCVENKRIINEYGHFSQNAIFVKQEEMEELITFFKLVGVDNNVIILSMDEPFGSGSIMQRLHIPINEYVSGTFLWRPNDTDQGKY